MDRFELLDDLIIMIKTREIDFGEMIDADEAENMLKTIKAMVQQSIYNEIIQDITDSDTMYYAPEYASWREFLSDCNGNNDYERVLFDFEESELEELWQNSHIAEDMPEDKIREKLTEQIGQLKMITLIGRKDKMANRGRIEAMAKGMKAQIKGLYNMLYE